MRKKVAKFVSCILVSALIMQDGITAAAVNHFGSGMKIVTVPEKNTVELTEESLTKPTSEGTAKTEEATKIEEETTKTEETVTEEATKMEEETATEEATKMEEETAKAEETATEETTKTEETATELESEIETETEEKTVNTAENSEEITEEYNGYPGDEVIVGEQNLLPEELFVSDDENTNGLKYWTKWDAFVSSMESGIDNKSITLKISDTPKGAKWGTGLQFKTNLGLEGGSAYQISYKITSTAARKVTIDFDEKAEMDRREFDLKADTETTVRYIETATGNWNKFSFFLGEGDNTASYGAHDITISDVSIKKVTIKLKDGDTVEETADNLLTNGTFKDGNTEGWEVNKETADVKCAKYKVAFDITGNPADWQIWLKQNISLESSTKYKITFDATSTVDRYIMAGCDGGTWLQHKELKANKPTKVEYQVTGMSGNNFVIALGSNLRASSTYKDENGNEVSSDAAKDQKLDPHRVVLSNICIVEVPPELPDTPNDTPYAKINNLSGHNGYKPEDLIALKDGRFTQPLKRNWTFWHEEWMTQWKEDAVTCTPIKDGVEVYVEITGGDPLGNHPWDVQLSQKISLSSNTKYVLSFKVKSEKARSINVSIADIDKGNAWVKPIAIQKGETREVTLNLPELTEDAIDKTFQIQMGNVSGNVSDNTLTFTDFKLEVNGYAELAEKISDGYFNDGQKGNFNVTDGGKASISFNDSYIKAEITSACNPEDVVVSSETFDLIGTEGSDRYPYEYEVSFVAGATESGREIKAVLADASNNTLKEEIFPLTIDAEKYTFSYKPDKSYNNVTLKLLLGGSEESICVDTIRCDLKGYPVAAGLDASEHNITLLKKEEPPVISEMPADKAVTGNDIVLSFNKNGNEDYKNAISEITIDGKKVDADKYQLGERAGSEGRNDEYIITLNNSLFEVKGSRQTFTIEVKAPWYQKNRVRQTVYTDSPWSSTWLEEFDGTALDETKWSYQDGTGAEYGNDGWGNNEQQYYTRDNLKVADGELVITAQKERRDGKKYTSARIWTMEDDQKTAKFGQTYGRMEAKMKLAGGKGYEGVWPAFWMLPVDVYYGTWPLSGEIDILETRGREPDKVDGTVHYGKPWPNNASQGGVYEFSQSEYGQGSDINDYHVYAVEWEPGEIRWYVDDECYFTYRNWYSQSPDNPQKFRYPAPFDQDFYIILNLAIGGTFDENRLPDDDKLPVDMKVDYVRVYESKDGYQDVTEEPPVIKDMDTDISQVKSELRDTAFEGINIVTEAGKDLKRDCWNLVSLPQFYGSADFATVTKDGQTYAKIIPKDLGIAAHAIQLIQHLDLVKGYSYRVSFDAWTEGGRKLNMKIGQDGTEGWDTYETNEISLGNTMQHYKYEFQAGKTDRHSRIEFNIATSMQPVYIGNIKYEVIEEIVIDEDAEKKPSENGNCVYNGSFDVGKINGLSYWHLDGSDGKTVRDGKGYAFTASKGDLYQYGLQLLQNDTYKLTFVGEAAGTHSVEVVISSHDKATVYKKETVTLTTDRETKEVIFTMPQGVTDTNASLCFSFGESGTALTLTDICLKRTTYNNIEWGEVNAHPLLNGDFESGALYWTQYGDAGLTIKADEEGNHYAQVNGKKGGNKWDVLLIYDGLEITGKTDYEFSFDVRADKNDENIRVTMEDSGYYAHFEQKELEVGTEWKHYVFDLRFTDTQNLALKFQTGDASEDYMLCFDNVVLRAKGAPKAPGIIMAQKYNRLGTDIVLSYNGEEDWVKNAEVYINNVKVDTEKAVFSDGKLTLASDVFSETGFYTLTIRSSGYTPSRAIDVLVYPANGNRILNGGFTMGKNGLDYWDQYIKDAEKDYVTSQDGEARIHYGGPSYDGENLVSWAIQFFQDKIPVESGKKYQLSFIAYATTERRIQVMRNQGQGELSQYVAITNEPQIYELEFVSTGDNLKLQFLLSTVAKEDGAPITADDILETHDIYLDNITILEMVDGKPQAADKTELDKLFKECDSIIQNKDKYTGESYQAFLKAYNEAKEILKKIDAKQVEIDRAQDNLNEAKKGLELIIDRTSLKELIDECKEILDKKDYYTEASFNSFKAMYEEAQKVLEDENAKQSDIDQAEENLQNAKESLIPVEIKKEDLQRLIDECKELKQSEYTSESWELFADVLDKAEKILNSSNTSQQDIDDVYTKLVEAKATLEQRKPEVPDKTQLSNLISECENILDKKEDYTEESWIPFAKALEDAKAVQADPDASQEAIQKAIEALQTAKENLQKHGDPEPVNKDQLKDLIQKCEKLNKNEYTKSSWEVFEKALKEAETIADSETATQKDIQDAVQKLSDTLEQLKDREGLWAFEIAEVTYTGKAVKPNVTVYNGKKMLTQGKDYTITYKNNKKVTDNAQAIIKGKGNYSGGITKEFKIKPKDFASADIQISNIYVKAPKTGKSVTPAPTVTRNGKKLSKKEYVIGSIKNSNGETVKEVTESGIYAVEVNGVKTYGYTGSREIQMTVLRSDQVLMNAVKVTGNKNIPYTGETINPEFTVKYGKEILTPNQDYIVICDSKEIGSATALIKGIGEKYVGEKIVTFKITGTVLKAKDVTVDAVGVVYTGNPIEPAVSITGADCDRDYTVSYQNNVKAGTAVVTVTGIGKYTGVVKKKFKITAFDFGKNDRGQLKYNTNITVPYAKGGSTLKESDLQAVFGGMQLTEGIDYTLVYTANKKAGSAASVKIKGKGNFKGTTDTIEFTITEQDLALTDILVVDVVEKNAKNYKRITPVIKDLNGKALKKGTDFIISGYTKTDGTELTETPKVGDTVRITVEGINNYTEKAYADFKIIDNNCDISKAKVKIEPQSYTGKEIILSESDSVTGKPQIQVTMKVNGKTETLVEGIDYEIVKTGYSNNINKGTGKMTIKGINAYGGIKTVSFKITTHVFQDDEMEWYKNLYSRTVSWFNNIITE